MRFTLSMSPPGSDSLESLSNSDLRAVVRTLVGQFEQARADNDALRSDIAALKSEDRTLKDGIARLKGSPLRPLKPSGMEKLVQAGSGAGKNANMKKHYSATIGVRGRGPQLTLTIARE